MFLAKGYSEENLPSRSHRFLVNFEPLAIAGDHDQVSFSIIDSAETICGHIGKM